MVLSGLLCVRQLPAQTQVVTIPEGFITLSIPAASGASTPSVTPICLPLHDIFQSAGASRGTISALTSTTLTDSGAGWTAGALSNASTPCFIQMTSGAALGRTLQILTTPANTATTVTVNNQGTDLTTIGIAAGDKYQIISGDTLSGIFGTSAQSGILAGTSADAADNVQVWNGTAWQIFYYNSTNNRWQQKGINVSANSFSIPAGKPFMVSKLGSSSGTQTLVQSLPYTLD